ncbi:MAG TPA: hypothetical protein V6C97_19965 [Oculatellaceae cyanobacterium]
MAALAVNAFEVDYDAFIVSSEGFHNLQERAILHNEQFAEVSAEASDFNFSAIYASALHELLEQSNLVTQFRCKVSLDVIGVVGCAVGCTLPFTWCSIITRHNVYAVTINKNLQIRMLSKTLHLLGVACGFFCYT